jgi:hypothetical protein
VGVRTRSDAVDGLAIRNVDGMTAARLGGNPVVVHAIVIATLYGRLRIAGGGEYCNGH